MRRVLWGDVDELSPTLFELLRSHVELVFAAAAQFEDWRVFRENAVDIDRDSIDALSQSTLALVRDLRMRKDATPEVTEALDTVASWTGTRKPTSGMFSPSQAPCKTFGLLSLNLRWQRKS
jgi:hypothetical protein